MVTFSGLGIRRDRAMYSYMAYCFKKPIFFYNKIANIAVVIITVILNCYTKASSSVAPGSNGTNL